MYKYNNKDVFNMYRGGSLIYDLYSETINTLYKNNEQGFVYDPNDLTDEKIKWRKNLLLNTEDFVALSTTGGYNSVKEVEGWLLNALLVNAAGWSLGSLYPIGAISANVGSGTIVRSIEFKKGTANEVRLGGASDNGAIFMDLNTMLVTRNAGNLRYVLTPLSGGWYRLEMWHYSVSFATTHLSHMFGWGISRTSSGFDAEGQVGSTVYARKPSFAFIPYETTEHVSYQAITDFNSDFLRQFPKHTLFQNSIGTIPSTSFRQPVGLVLDKSRGLALGVEKAINGDVSNGTQNWNTGNVDSSISAVEGKIRSELISNVNPRASLKLTGLDIGKMYKASLNVSPGTLTSPQYIARISTGPVLTPVVAEVINSFSINTATFIFRATASDMYVGAVVTTSEIGKYFEISGVTVKEIEGTHAFQATSASRPMLRNNEITGYNYFEFDGIDDYFEVVNLPSLREMSLVAGVNLTKVTSTASSLIARGTAGYPYLAKDMLVVQAVAGPLIVSSTNLDTHVVKYSMDGSVQGSTNTDTKSTNIASGLVGSNPAFIGTFSQSHAYKAGYHLYGMLVVNKLISTDEESVLRKIFNKRIGITQ